MFQIIDIAKVFIPSAAAFFIGLAITPLLTHYLYKYKAWKKRSVAVATDGRAAPISQRLHRDEEKKTPRMGGIIIWLSVLFTILAVWLISKIFPSDTTLKLDFLSRNQTWLPLFVLVVGSLIGLIDDILEVIGGGGDHFAGGLSLKKRLIVVLGIGSIGAWWFFVKLGISTIMIPFIGVVNLGFFFIPFFILVMMAVYSGGVIDGIDGLAGGVFASIFSAYAGIAFFQGQIDLAAFCAVIVGALLAFLWFNIPPARFYMSETGTMGLTLTLTTVAFLTDTVLILPIIAMPLLAASASSSIQLLSKKFRNGKKVFLVAPIHHHFEAIGWAGPKVVMRYWILSVVFALLGMILAFVG